jgi:hypothetical protein
MFPFAQEKRRKINLGGTTSVASQTDLLHSAKTRRTEREEIRRRHESARCIQSYWRSSQQSRAVKHILSERFQEDVLGLNGMRALVLIGSSESLLAQWSEAVIHAGDGKPSIHLNQGLFVPRSPCIPQAFVSLSSLSWTYGSRLTYLPFTHRLVVTICQRT